MASAMRASGDCYKRGHRYLTVVIDHDRGRLVWAAPGRPATSSNSTSCTTVFSVCRGGINVVVLAQTFFGPAALLAYLWLRSRGPERTMAQFLDGDEPAKARPTNGRDVPGQRRPNPNDRVAPDSRTGQERLAHHRALTSISPK